MSKIIMESDAPLVRSLGTLLELWSEHFRAQFSRPTATADLQLLAASETSHIDTSNPSETGVIERARFL